MIRAMQTWGKPLHWGCFALVLAWMLAGCVGPLPQFEARVPTPMPHPTVFWADFVQAHATELASLHPPLHLEVWDAVEMDTAREIIDGLYISHKGLPGRDGRDCYRLLRFYADSRLDSHNACFSEPPTGADVPDLLAAWGTGDIDLIQGDYRVIESESAITEVLIRLVAYDVLERGPELYMNQGQICGDRLMLQPLDSAPAPIGSTPVGFYTRLEDSATSVSGSLSGGCQMPLWEFERQMAVALAGNNTEYIIRTEPGAPCTLTYLPPEARATEAQESPGTGAIVADDAGICHWIWPVGTVAGNATVTVSIGPVQQAYVLRVNPTRSTP